MHADFSTNNLTQQIAIFNDALNAYDSDIAASNREKSLMKLTPGDYIGTILPRGTAPLPEK